jgi:hypothetical protein
VHSCTISAESLCTWDGAAKQRLQVTYGQQLAAMRVQRTRGIRLYFGICLARGHDASFSLSTIHAVIACSTRFLPLFLA